MLYTYVRAFLKPRIYGYGYKGLYRQAINEAFPIFVTMIWACSMPPLYYFLCIYRYKDVDDPHLRRFSYRYTVLRPEDERLDFYNLTPEQRTLREDLLKKQQDQ